MALRNEPDLTQADEDDGIIIVASDATPTGKPRYVKIADLPKIHQRVNPYIIKPKRVLLASYSLSNLASTTAANQLAIKEGATRHSFDDGYWGLVFEFQGLVLARTRVSLASWNTDRRVMIGEDNSVYMHIWREDTNAFRLLHENSIGAPQPQNSTNGYLSAIYGELLEMQRENS